MLRADPARSRGRLYPEPESRLRDAFARDRDRILHSTALRRLRDKTQVFLGARDDHFRVRLTHSLEVAQIARTLARALGLNEDLAEVCALGHDLGHPPFGHVGEEALDEAMSSAGGFDHNGHTIRILTRLEERDPAFPGLNLSWETLEGLAKHGGPVTKPGWALAEYNALHPLDLQLFPTLEAQVAGLADDIAYNAHDLDDGLRSGLITLDEALGEIPELGPLDPGPLAAPSPRGRDWRALFLVRETIGRLVDSLLEGTRALLAEARPQSPADVAAAGRPLVQLTPEGAALVQGLRRFLRARVYRHPDVLALRAPARRLVAELHALYAADPALLPAGWGPEDSDDEADRLRRAGDYVAGMTDRFAAREHRRLTCTDLLNADEVRG